MRLGTSGLVDSLDRSSGNYWHGLRNKNAPPKLEHRFQETRRSMNHSAWCFGSLDRSTFRFECKLAVQLKYEVPQAEYARCRSTCTSEALLVCWYRRRSVKIRTNTYAKIPNIALAARQITARQHSLAETLEAHPTRK